MSDQTPTWSKETLEKVAIVAGEKALQLDDRNPRGIYVEEQNLIEWELLGRTLCRLFGHREPFESEPMLNMHQQHMGTAKWCTRCGTVVEKEAGLDPF